MDHRGTQSRPLVLRLDSKDALYRILAKEPDDRPSMAAVALDLQRLTQPAQDGGALTAAAAPRRQAPLEDSGQGAIDVLALTDPEGARPPGNQAEGGAALDRGLDASTLPPRALALAGAASEVAGLPTVPPVTDSGRPRRTPGSLGSWPPGTSGSVWEPMEIVKTDYHSTPGMDISGRVKRKGRTAVYPPGMWVMIVYAVVALVLTLVRRGLVP
jgi:hypothetical protein